MPNYKEEFSKNYTGYMRKGRWLKVTSYQDEKIFKWTDNSISNDDSISKYMKSLGIKPGLEYSQNKHKNWLLKNELIHNSDPDKKNDSNSGKCALIDMNIYNPKKGDVTIKKGSEILQLKNAQINDHMLKNTTKNTNNQTTETKRDQSVPRNSSRRRQFHKNKSKIQMARYAYEYNNTPNVPNEEQQSSLSFVTFGNGCRFKPEVVKNKKRCCSRERKIKDLLSYQDADLWNTDEYLTSSDTPTPTIERSEEITFNLQKNIQDRTEPDLTIETRKHSRIPGAIESLSSLELSEMKSECDSLTYDMIKDTFSDSELLDDWIFLDVTK